MLVDVFENGWIGESNDIFWLDVGQNFVALDLVLLVESQTIKPTQVCSD